MVEHDERLEAARRRLVQGIKITHGDLFPPEEPEQTPEEWIDERLKEGAPLTEIARDLLYVADTLPNAYPSPIWLANAMEIIHERIPL